MKSIPYQCNANKSSQSKVNPVVIRHVCVWISIKWCWIRFAININSSTQIPTYKCIGLGYQKSYSCAAKSHSTRLKSFKSHLLFNCCPQFVVGKSISICTLIFSWNFAAWIGCKVKLCASKLKLNFFPNRLKSFCFLATKESAEWWQALDCQ